MTIETGDEEKVYRIRVQETTTDLGWDEIYSMLAGCEWLYLFVVHSLTYCLQPNIDADSLTTISTAIIDGWMSCALTTNSLNYSSITETFS